MAQVAFGCGRGRVPYLLDREQNVRAAVEHSRFLAYLRRYRDQHAWITDPGVAA